MKNNYRNIAYSPQRFKAIISQENSLFDGVKANDSRDLINFLLERMHQELNKSKRLQKNNDKIEKNINEKKLKSASVNKRNIQKEKNKELSDDEKTRRDNKNIFKDNIFLSSNKNGLEAKRINTERNIHKIGIKANSIDKTSLLISA